MKTKKMPAAVIVLCAMAVLLIVGSASTIFVPENRYVCVKRFGKVDRVEETAGLALRIPFLESTTSLPKTALVYDLKPSDVLTIDKKTMTVSSYVVWKISDPVKFLQTVVTTFEAENRLNAKVYTAVNNTISSLEQAEVISLRGKDLDAQIAATVRVEMAASGVEVIDIQLKQFDLPQDNKEAVYKRMVSEREQMAAKFIAEGKEQAEIIRNQADRDAAAELSKARADAAEIRAEGESEYMKILAEAYAGPERAEFYEFIRSLDALKVSMQGDKTLVLPVDSPLTKWFIAR